MSADIVQELESESRSCINLADGAQNAIVNERENRLAMQFSRAAAEIVRLRGEVALAAGWHDEAIAPAAQVQGEATLPVVIFGDTYEVPIRVQLHIVNQQMKLDALGQTNRHHAVLDLLDATEHCLSAADEGVDYAVSRPMLDAMTTLGLMQKVGRGRWAPTDSARRFVTLARTAHPSACELGAWSALELFVRHAEEVDLGHGDGVVTTCESLAAAKAALQHRGDSQEVGRG